MAAPLTVFMNSVRIGMIAMLVNSYGIGQAEGFLHLFEGWVIFGACVAILFGVAVLLQRLTPHPLALRETIDLDFHGLRPAAARHPRRSPPRAAWRRRRRMTLAVAPPSCSTPAPDARPVRTATASRCSRASLGDWTGLLQDRSTREVARCSNASDYVNASYAAPGERNYVNFFSAWYEKQTEGAGHPFARGLPAGGRLGDVLDRAGTRCRCRARSTAASR